MIKYFMVTNPNGEIIIIELKNPERSGFFVRGIEGLGPTKSVINMGESLYQDGSYFNSVRAVSRNIVLNLGFLESNIETIEQLRYKSYRFFPLKTLLDFEIRTDARIGRVSGYVESNEPDIFSKEEGSVISIVCPEAYFFGGGYIETVFSGISSAFEFPFENPSLTENLIVFGNIFIDTEANVFYTGEISTGVIIYIYFLGPVNDLIIHNATQGQNMAISSDKLIELTGSDFVAGDLVVISTVKGDKYINLIRNNQVINILNTVDILSDWFTIEKGDNVFTYTADSGLSNLEFVIYHRILYEGI